MAKMEELQARHRREAKELQAKVTTKKKQASKKTRKGVNDECERLEQDLKARQANEVAELQGNGIPHDDIDETGDVADQVANLSVNEEPADDTSAIPKSAAATEADEPVDETPTRKPNRARARLERRKAEQEALAAQAASEASNLPDLKAAERERMLANSSSRGLTEREIRADGHCLYSAFADQMDALGLPLGAAPGMQPEVGLLEGAGTAGGSPGYRIVRAAAGEYMASHADDFGPYLEEDLDGYVDKVKNTAEWGGQLELIALSRRYGVQIDVLQGDGRVEEIKPEGVLSDKIVWLAYYRHGFGLGEHYNSLRRVGG